MSQYIQLNTSILPYYLIDFMIVIALLASLRFLSGLIANVSSKEELSEKDNAAFGISMAAAVVSIAIMLTGILSGEASSDPINEAINMLIYGIAGIVLMWLTRILFDRFSFPHLSIHDELMKGNVSASIVDAGNMIATAIVLRAVINWVTADLVQAMMAIGSGYIISQVLMVLATLYRAKVFVSRHPEGSLHQEIENGNTALALRFVGYRIGIALAVTGAAGVVNFSADTFYMSVAVWGCVSLMLFIILTFFAIITRLAILPGIDVADEVDNQKNIAIGVVEGAIYIAIGCLIAGLFG